VGAGVKSKARRGGSAFADAEVCSALGREEFPQPKDITMRSDPVMDNNHDGQAPEGIAIRL
jgi:hypothetical protein